MSTKPDPFAQLKPSIDWGDHKHSAISRRASEQRAKAMASDDPEKRILASGTIQGLLKPVDAKPATKPATKKRK